jgi:hypothetical protein
MDELGVGVTELAIIVAGGVTVGNAMAVHLGYYDGPIGGCEFVPASVCHVGQGRGRYSEDQVRRLLAGYF